MNYRSVLRRKKPPSPIKGEKGEPKGLVAVARDITERKQVEDALRESEEYFRALMDNSLDAITIMSEDGTTRYESPSYERLLGFKPEERVDSNLFDRIHQDDMAKVAEFFAEFLKNRGGTIHTEVRAQHKDGSWHIIEAIGRNLLDNPVVKGIVVNSRDITERKKAEDTLRESESKYRTLFESSTDAIMTLDENGFIDCNTATLKMFACSQKSEFVSLHPADISPPNQPDGTDSKASADLRIAEAFKSGSAQFEWVHRRKNGRDFPADVLLSAFKLGEKQVLQATVRDITERKRMEGELEKLASVVRYSSELVNLATIDGKMIFLNEAGAKMLGIDLEEVEQINIMQVIPDHLKERTRTEVLSALGGGWYLGRGVAIPQSQDRRTD